MERHFTATTFIIDDNKILYDKFEISNNISKGVLDCRYPGELVSSKCKLRVSRDMQTRMLDSVTNELIYPYSSLYVYTSQFIDNTYSPFSIMTNKLYDKSSSSFSSNSINDQSMRILNDGRLFVQEICPFDVLGTDSNITIYRALANVYFWNSTRDETTVNRRNLGYFSQSQTYLAHYIHSIIQLSTNEIVNILNIFFKKFKIDVSLQIDSSIIRRNEIENSPYHVYISLNSGTVSSISVGFDLIDVSS